MGQTYSPPCRSCELTPADGQINEEVLPLAEHGDDQQAVQVDALHQQPVVVGHHAVLHHHHGAAAPRDSLTQGAGSAGVAWTQTTRQGYRFSDGTKVANLTPAQRKNTQPLLTTPVQGQGRLSFTGSLYLTQKQPGTPLQEPFSCFLLVLYANRCKHNALCSILYEMWCVLLQRNKKRVNGTKLKVNYIGPRT